MIAAAESEALLVEQAKHDRQAFLALYDQTVERIYRYAYYRVRSQAEAEDTVSETYSIALRSMSKYVYTGVPFVAWLYRIASSVIAHTQRQKRWTAPGELTELDQLVTGEEEQVDLRGDLAMALQSLPAEQQKAIVLRYISDLPLREIAEMTGHSEGAVKQLLHRGLIKLRERMISYGQDN